MLVLSRKSKQRIQVGENIVITILQVRGQTVRVGIEAPGDVRVLRSEIAGDPVAAADEHVQTTNTRTATTQTADEVPAGRSSMPRPERIEAGRGENDPGFSSPLVGCTSIVGESAGLYPFVRRRALRKPAASASLVATRS